MITQQQPRGKYSLRDKSGIANNKWPASFRWQAIATRFWFLNCCLQRFSSGQIVTNALRALASICFVEIVVVNHDFGKT